YWGSSLGSRREALGGIPSFSLSLAQAPAGTGSPAWALMAAVSACLRSAPACCSSVAFGIGPGRVGIWLGAGFVVALGLGAGLALASGPARSMMISVARPTSP